MMIESDLGAESLLCLQQLLCWMFHNDILPTSEQLNSCLMCTAVILQNQQLSMVIGQKDHVSWIASIVSSIYQVFLSCESLHVLILLRINILVPYVQFQLKYKGTLLIYS